MTIHLKATEQQFPFVLLIMMYKMVPTFESVDEIIQCDHSNEAPSAVLFVFQCVLQIIFGIFLEF